jgi:biopolymer transport protein ExbD
MRTKRPPEAMKIQPPLIPVIDVVFDLLIFFLLIPSTGSSDGYLTTNLPESEGPVSSKQIKHEERIRIDILDVVDHPDQVEIIFAENKNLGGDFKALTDSLVTLGESGMSKETPILLAPTMACRQKFVVKGFDAAVTAGFKKIQFAVPYE